MTSEEYKLKNGQTITKYKDGPYFYVCCFNEDDACQWSKMYRNETDANVEFERWIE